MFNLPKTLITGIAAFALTSAASAQQAEEIEFRYDMTASTEANYAAFERTARRACDDTSVLYSKKMELDCRADLLDQAVAATKQDAFIAYHQQVNDRAV